jgi:hypothetical protein
VSSLLVSQHHGAMLMEGRRGCARKEILFGSGVGGQNLALPEKRELSACVGILAGVQAWE